jgi:hypothetical protein
MPIIVKNPKANPAATPTAPDAKVAKDRSPSFPFIPLKTAVERLEAFEKYFGRHPAPAAKAGLAWGMKEKSSQADQTLAALRSFGLLKYEGMGSVRVAALTEEGRTYLRAQQESVKKQILKQSALRPKIIRKFWTTWGVDRPPDAVALDDLTLKNSFSDGGAPNFLKVYDDTIAFAGLSDSDKISPSAEESDVADEEEGAGDLPPPPPPPLPKGKVILMAGERELTSGLLSKNANFRLIVSGTIGAKEIERLIKKLEFDKEILADQSADQDEEAAN